LSCNGTGYRLLSAPLLDVWRLVRRGSWTAPRLASKLKSTPTAMNNRLETLRALGLVERQRDGRAWIYTVNH
jgi:predicted transcriptional regulator